MASLVSSHPRRLDYGNGEVIKPGSNLMVMHPSAKAAHHAMVIDPDLAELEATGQLLGGQGFKVTLSSAALDLDSLAYIAPDVLVVRPPVYEFRAWRAYLRTVQGDRRLAGIPIIVVAIRPAHRTAMVNDGMRCLSWPWRPLDLLTVVDSSIAGVAAAGGGRPDDWPPILTPFDANGVETSGGHGMTG